MRIVAPKLRRLQINSVANEPTVARLHAPAATLGGGLWIAVRPPGDRDGADHAPETDAAITRWTHIAAMLDVIAKQNDMIKRSYARPPRRR